jgi:hypothetical protein
MLRGISAVHNHDKTIQLCGHPRLTELLVVAHDRRVSAQGGLEWKMPWVWSWVRGIWGSGEGGNIVQNVAKQSG